jgi:hypothetical protein
MTLRKSATRPKERWAILGVLVTTLLLVGSAVVFAVHDEGVFQLDGNASTAAQSTPNALEDWDLICKAHPDQCVFAPGYTQPSGTTLANPSAFKVDPSQSSIDDILKGGTKDDNDMNTWAWTSAKPSPPKNDLTDGFAAEYTCNDSSADNNVADCTGTAGDSLLYFGADRYSNSGSANVAFWFFQKKVLQQGNQPDGTCTISSGCPFVDSHGNPATHTVGDVSLGGDTPGDILIISAFGPKAQIFVFEWVGAGNATKNYLGTNGCFTANCSLQPLFVGSTTSDCPEVTNDNACALANDTSSASPWMLPQKSGGDNQFSPTDLFEGGINLTQLGLAESCFSSFLINSRASAAGDAELHDKILGQLGRCSPNLSTQVKDSSGTDTNGTIQPGTAVHDTATVTVTGATSPADATGHVDFFLCSSTSGYPDCSMGGTQVGGDVDLTDTSPSPGNTTDGISGASSADVNGTGHELGNGYYCFRAVASLTNYDSPDAYTDGTNECFRVLKLDTTIETDPQSPSGTPNTGPFDLKDSPTIYDHAVVTGATGGGFPEGSVTFYICIPSEVSGGVCPSTAGTQVGSAKTLTHVSGETIKSEATSEGYPITSTSALGVYCFRADYTSTSPVYNGKNDASTTSECFTIQNASSASSTQDWLPNDHVTVTADAGSIAGTLTVALYKDSCDGTLVYTDADAIDFTATSSGATYDTSNTTHLVSTASAADYFWRIVFTPTSSYAGGVVTKCEQSTLTIDNNP